MLAGDDLTIVLFALGAAVTFGVSAATTAGLRPKLLVTVQSFLAAVFVAVAGAWPWLKPNAPRMAAIIAAIATNPASWFVTLLFAITLITVSLRASPQPDNRTEAPIWALIAVALILFIVALFVYPPNPSSPSVNHDLANRVATLETRQGQAPPAPSDARIPELLSKVTKLETKITSIDNLILAQTCLEALNSQAPKDTIETDLTNARQFLAKPPPPGGHVGRTPVDQWNMLLQSITALTQSCDPKGAIQFKYEPSGEEIERSAPGEPKITLDNMVDPDIVHRYRRFYVQSQSAVDKIAEYRGQLEKSIIDAAPQIVHSSP